MKKIFSLFAAILFAGGLMAQTLFYTLTPASGTNTAYASACDIEIAGIKWNLTGNSQMQPWRIGGKNLNGVDRALFSKTPMEANISKIVVEHGAASNITVNSFTVIVASDAAFSNVISTLTPAFVVNNEVEISRPAGKDWSNAYYKFVYNVTVSGSSNKFVEFVGAKFYGEGAAPTVVAAPQFSLEEGEYEGAQSVEISCTTDGATIYYTLDGSAPTAASNVYSEAIPVAATTTIKAFAAKAGLDNSAIVSATYTIVAGADLVLDFTDNTAWDIPLGSTKVKGLHEYSNGDYSISLFGPEDNGFYYDGTNNNILLGKEGAYMALPVFASQAIQKIATTGVANGAFAVSFNIFEGDNEVSTEVTNCKVDQTFLIASPKKNAQYIIKVTNANNLRIAKVKFWFGEEGPTTAIENTAVEAKAIKRFVNGQLVIEKAGVLYNAQGAVIK